MGALGLAAGCVKPVALAPTIKPEPRPQAASTPEPSATSRNLARHYARIQADLLTQGLLRTDGGGPDTPFDSRTLTEDFIRIALYDEYVARGSMIMARETEGSLRRWGAPIQLGLSFGPTTPNAQRRKDSDTVARYARRLQRASGHSITITPQSKANYHVFFLNEDERRAFGPELRALVPGIPNSVVRAITQMSRSTLCLVFAQTDPATGTYTQAVSIIRSEHPDLLRNSCIHEELAQGMGLANDSPQARPSVFNDDEEFALLTTHDEMLLRILYDPRLRPGMTKDQARPIVARISKELMGDDI